MSGVLISTSVIWFCGRRQKPCCCALHFINHCFMWTRSEPPSPPPTPPHPPSAAAGPSALFTRPSGGSQDQTSSLVITLDYFHLPEVSEAFQQREETEKKDGPGQIQRPVRSSAPLHVVLHFTASHPPFTPAVKPFQLFLFITSCLLGVNTETGHDGPQDTTVHTYLD